MNTGKVQNLYLVAVVGLLFALASAGCAGPGEPATPSSPPPAPPPAAEQTGCPELVFDDAEFAFELRRTLSAACSGEADLGECLYTAARISEPDFESWYREWYATAEHVRASGEESLMRGHTVSARDTFYRAATYYRTAEFFLHGDPTDPRILDTWGKSRDMFVQAAQLDTVPFEMIEILYEDTTLPAYFYSVDNSGKKRPLLIVQTGFDGCQEELHPYAVQGIKRGYNVLTFEGPGQGAVARSEQSSIPVTTSF